ncbi:MAG: DUF1428 domain-containing protein [Pseudomonadota bacterium]|nr:DUF1428 domain-containing protein [Pseudomonadota bacterium]
MYVDGFVTPVARAKLDAYRRHAEQTAPLWKKHGATRYVECVADDVPSGKLTSFPQAVMLGEDEVVVLAWVTYPSREVRDRCLAAVMQEPAIRDMKPEDWPFDGKRMFWGGFESLVTL